MVKTRTSWKKGQCGNPKGQPKLPPEVKELRKLTIKEYTELVDRVIHLPKEEIQAILKSSTATTLEAFVAAIALKGVSGGDPQRLGFLLDRLIGPVKQKVDLTSEDGSMTPKIELVPTEQLIKRVQEISEKLKKNG